MSETLAFTLQWSDWLDLFVHYLALSAMAIGGAITTAPDMYRYLVEQQHWLTPAQYATSIAIAQAAPGPNVLFVALMGWNVGMNAGGYGWAALGVLITMAGMLLPSTTLTYLAAQWGHTHRDWPVVRAFKQGLAPIVVALLFATGILLAGTHMHTLRDWPVAVVVVASALLVWRTRVHLLWLLTIGAALGATGWL